MNIIANQIIRLASELKPRLKLTIKKDELSEKEIRTIQVAVQNFVETVRKNEGLECLISRWDNDEATKLTISFNAHSAMKDIISKVEEIVRKQGRSVGAKIKFEKC